MHLSEDQILALAPDESSRKSGKDLANSAKWVSKGANDAALWGECQGSGSKPFQTQIDLGNLAFKCSCPSRKFPCKHGLGLLISTSEHGEINTDLVSHINLLDIIEIDGVEPLESRHQSENVFYDESSIQVVGTYPKTELGILCENERPLIFGNRGKAVAQDVIYRLHHSLLLIRINDFEVNRAPSEWNADRRMQSRLLFSYKANQYDFPITDPAFLEEFQNDSECIAGVNELFITLSL